MTARWREGGEWQRLAMRQAGVIARRQLMALGWTEDDLEAATRGRGLIRVRPGVFSLFGGPLPPAAWGWAMILDCGAGAALVGESALAADGIVPPGRLLHIGVDTTRRVRSADGVCLHRRVRFGSEVVGDRRPPRQCREAAALTWWEETERPDDAISGVLRVVGSRRVSAEALLREVDGRRRVRRRAALVGLLQDAASGSHSELERRYRRAVHIAHALPRAAFNPLEIVAGRRRYRDVRYEIGIVIELDGEAFHAVSGRAGDRRRDNELILAGVPTLRYGWAEVVGRPCSVAAEVAALLRRLGWTGETRRCGRGCGLPV